jgi:predicted DNA-binding transcriptional regulator AlpA
MTLDEILSDPAAAARLGAAERAALLGKALVAVSVLAAAPAIAVNGNGATPPASEPRPEPDRTLDLAEAATLLGVKPAWLTRHARTLPFTRKLGHRTVRYSEAGIRRWLAARRP